MQSQMFFGLLRALAASVAMAIIVSSAHAQQPTWVFKAEPDYIVEPGSTHQGFAFSSAGDVQFEGQPVFSRSLLRSVDPAAAHLRLHLYTSPDRSRVYAVYREWDYGGLGVALIELGPRRVISKSFALGAGRGRAMDGVAWSPNGEALIFPLQEHEYSAEAALLEVHTGRFEVRRPRGVNRGFWTELKNAHSWRPELDKIAWRGSAEVVVPFSITHCAVFDGGCNDYKEPQHLSDEVLAVRSDPLGASEPDGKVVDTTTPSIPRCVTDVGASLLRVPYGGPSDELGRLERTERVTGPLETRRTSDGALWLLVERQSGQRGFVSSRSLQICEDSADVSVVGAANAQLGVSTDVLDELREASRRVERASTDAEILQAFGDLLSALSTLKGSAEVLGILNELKFTPKTITIQDLELDYLGVVSSLLVDYLYERADAKGIHLAVPEPVFDAIVRNAIFIGTGDLKGSVSYLGGQIVDIAAAYAGLQAEYHQLLIDQLEYAVLELDAFDRGQLGYDLVMSQIRADRDVSVSLAVSPGSMWSTDALQKRGTIADLQELKLRMLNGENPQVLKSALRAQYQDDEFASKVASLLGIPW
jgi:hypothetical protein